jgi:hypothetical protein
MTQEIKCFDTIRPWEEKALVPYAKYTVLEPPLPPRDCMETMITTVISAIIGTTDIDQLGDKDTMDFTANKAIIDTIVMRAIMHTPVIKVIVNNTDLEVVKAITYRHQ